MGEPTWMYRRTAKGDVSEKVFDSDSIPPGWVDSPAKCVKKAPVEKPVKERQPERRFPAEPPKKTD